MVRAGFGLFTGPFDYSDIMVSWQGASAFTNMKQPILPEFADPSNKLVGLGPFGHRWSRRPLSCHVRHSTTSRTTERTLTPARCFSFLWDM